MLFGPVLEQGGQPAVTGSRKWVDPDLSKLLDVLNPVRIVHGGALGADSHAHYWAKKRGRVSVVYFPDWDNVSKAALVRNIKMLEDWPQAVVLGCPMAGSRGTWHTMKNAEKRGMTVINATEMLEDYRAHHCPDCGKLQLLQITER